MAFNRIWTEEEDRKLLALREAGRSSRSIAAKLKRTAGAVNSRLSVLRKSVQEVAISETTP